MKKTCLLIVLLLPLFIKGQTLFDTQQRLTLQSGIDPATLITLRYERRLQEVFLQRDLYPMMEFSSSLTRIGIKNSEFKLGNRLPIWRHQNMGLIAGINASYGRVETLNFESKKLALEGDIAFGYYGSKGFIAITTAYEKILTNHLRHSQYYRDRFYPEAVNGWYKGSGGSIQIGFEGGVVIKKSFDVFMEIKIPTTEKFNAIMGSPGHVNVGIGHRF